MIDLILIDMICRKLCPWTQKNYETLSARRCFIMSARPEAKPETRTYQQTWGRESLHPHWIYDVDGTPRSAHDFFSLGFTRKINSSLLVTHVRPSCDLLNVSHPSYVLGNSLLTHAPLLCEFFFVCSSSSSNNTCNLTFLFFRRFSTFLVCNTEFTTFEMPTTSLTLSCNGVCLP